MMFDPFQLELGVTPDTVKETLGKEDYGKGMKNFILWLKLKIIITIMRARVTEITLS